MRLSVLIAVCLVGGAARAEPTAAPVRAEIDALLSKLQSSGCEFKRNGTWHGGAEAKDHLLSKLKYIEGKGSVQTTEQFIELAATQSSWSGTPYQVRCAGEPLLASRVWLGRQLGAIRAAGGQGKP